MMRQDENRRMIGRLVTPPTLSFLIPGTAARTEHIPAHDESGGLDYRLDCGGVRLGLFEHPPVQAGSPFAQRILQALTRTCNEAIKRNRQVGCDSAHKFRTPLD